MLVKLTAHLEANAGTSAVCGRQRVMSAYLQNKGTEKPRSGELLARPTEYMLRQVQTYDFEADHPVSKAAFDFLGWLPVLPGPCGMYRFEDLCESTEKHPLSRRDKYFELVNRESEDCGLVLSNLKIAEDRIPSLYAVFHETGAFKTHWVHDAVFYFEAETELRDLVLQRRRWLNGTNAGYLHIMLNVRKYIWSSQHSLTMKLCTTIMLAMQLLQIAVLSLGPSIFASILFAILFYVFTPACPFTDLYEREFRLRHLCMDSLSDGLPFPIETPANANDCTIECAKALVSYLQCEMATEAKPSPLAQLKFWFDKTFDYPSHRDVRNATFYKNVSESILFHSCRIPIQSNGDEDNSNLMLPGNYSKHITTVTQITVASTGMSVYLLFYIIFLWVHRVKFRKVRTTANPLYAEDVEGTPVLDYNGKPKVPAEIDCLDPDVAEMIVPDGAEAGEKVPVDESLPKRCCCRRNVSMVTIPQGALAGDKFFVQADGSTSLMTPKLYQSSMFPTSGDGWNKEPGSDFKSWAWKVAILLNAMVVLAFLGTLYAERAVFSALLQQTEEYVLGTAVGRNVPGVGEYKRVQGQGINCYDSHNPFKQLQKGTLLGDLPYGQNETFDEVWREMKPVATTLDLLQPLSFTYSPHGRARGVVPFTDIFIDKDSGISEGEPYVFFFRGRVTFHQQGIYNFSMTSDRSSMLYVQKAGDQLGSVLLLDNDAGHQSKTSTASKSERGTQLTIENSAQITQTDTRSEYEVIIVYWTNGKPGSKFEVQWTGGKGHTPINKTHPVSRYETIAEGNWEYWGKGDWTINAYQESCWHWLSDEIEGSDNPQTEDFVEEKDMWIESTHKTVCTADMKYTLCTEAIDLYYFPKSALRCGRPAAHYSDEQTKTKSDQQYWHTAYVDAGKKCGAECMPGHVACPSPCDSAATMDGSCNVCVDLTSWARGAEGKRKYDNPTVDSCAKSDKDPAMALLIFLVMNVYVLIPLLFSFIDAPFSASLKSPLMLMRSALIYIIFMPTFVAWFAAYSTNRLSDVSWGQRAVENGITRGELKIVKNAVKVSGCVVIMNLGFAIYTAFLRTKTDTTLITNVSRFIMVIAGYQFGISFISYISRAWDKVVCNQRILGDDSRNTGLGSTDLRASFARTSYAMRATRHSMRMKDFENNAGAGSS
jgi:hypothetical protein